MNVKCIVCSGGSALVLVSHNALKSAKINQHAYQWMFEWMVYQTNLQHYNGTEHNGIQTVM